MLLIQQLLGAFFKVLKRRDTDHRLVLQRQQRGSRSPCVLHTSPSQFAVYLLCASGVAVDLEKNVVSHLVMTIATGAVNRSASPEHDSILHSLGL